MHLYSGSVMGALWSRTVCNLMAVVALVHFCLSYPRMPWVDVVSLLAELTLWLSLHLWVCRLVPACISTSQLSRSIAGGEEAKEECDSTLILCSWLEEIAQAIIADPLLRVNQSKWNRPGWCYSTWPTLFLPTSDFLNCFPDAQVTVK